MEPTTVDLLIQGFSPRGFGVADSPNRPVKVEVAHAIPGDRVRVQLFRKRHRVQKGKLQELLEASQDRIEPKCAHASLCGGCCWQSMGYEKQLEHKQQSVRRAFGDLMHSDVEVRPMIPCEQPFGYRNKMEFSFSENRAGDRFLGLMIAHAEPYVFNVEKCELAPAWMSECLQRVRAWWIESGLAAYYPPKDSGTLRYLTLREAVHTQQKMAILNVSGNPEFAPPREQIEKFAQAVGDMSVFLRIHQAKKGAPTQFFEMHLGGSDHLIEELHLKTGKLRFKISPSSFFQPNTRQAEKLYDAALELLPEGCSLLFDLYCGTGTMAMAAAKRAKQVVGIELSPEAVLDAEANAAMNGLENVQFHRGDVGKVLARQLGAPEAVIVDPPRAGLDEQALKHLVELAPQRMIYVSCNPLTQADNVRALVQAGYKLVSLQAVDQFPHTAHIENIALLKR